MPSAAAATLSGTSRPPRTARTAADRVPLARSSAAARNMSTSVTSSPSTSRPRSPCRSTTERRALPLSPAAAGRTSSDILPPRSSTPAGAAEPQRHLDRGQCGRRIGRRANMDRGRETLPLDDHTVQLRHGQQGALHVGLQLPGPAAACRRLAAPGSSHSRPWLPTTRSASVPRMRRASAADLTGDHPDQRHPLDKTPQRRSGAVHQPRGGRVLHDERQRAVQVGEHGRRPRGQCVLRQPHRPAAKVLSGHHRDRC